jgi:AraC-like DNA-binding protein
MPDSIKKTETTEENISLMAACHLKGEPLNYHLLREEGQDAVNFVHFLSPAKIVCKNQSHYTDKNACIIYTAGVRQEYLAAGGERLINNFVTFRPPRRFLPSFNLPLNTPFNIRDDSEVTRLVEQLTWAAASRNDAEVWGQTAGLQTDRRINDWIWDLFSTLEELQIIENPKDKRAFMTKQRFIELRNTVRQDPRGWTVDKMARTVWLTRSRFSVLYKEFFGVSPGGDLLNASISRAKALLESTEMKISDIAADCGYTDAEYFIKLFRRMTGEPPARYRKNYRKRAEQAE